MANADIDKIAQKVGEEMKKPHDPTFSELRRIKRNQPASRPGYVPERISKDSDKVVQPKDIHSSGKIVKLPGEELGPLQRMSHIAGELKPGTIRKAMDFIKGKYSRFPDEKEKPAWGVHNPGFGAYAPVSGGVHNPVFRDNAGKEIDKKGNSNPGPEVSRRMSSKKPQFGPKDPPKYRPEMDERDPKSFPPVRPASEMKSMDFEAIAKRFVEKELSPEGQRQFRNTVAREQRIKDWHLPEYERRERDQAKREARKQKQSMRVM